jgi:glycosyltransferase involved in cell wall biosynthesis
MPPPVFGFLAFTSGSFEGAIIRDMRLANELHRRGFPVRIYWMMERNAELVDPGIPQRMFVNGMRWQFRRPSRVWEALGRLLGRLPAVTRREFMQRHPDYVDRLMRNLVGALCDGAETDRPLIRRLRRMLRRDGVTHLLPTFAMICPFAQAARDAGGDFDYLPTFQGEEIFANYAQQLGRLEEYYQLLRQTLAGSRWPGVAVSRDYLLRLRDEMGLDPQRLRPIYPGIELPREKAPPSFDVLAPKFPRLRPDVPIVTYIGRQDSEKGIDLLLYAARMLQDKGVALQLVVCGGSSFGQRYRDVIKHIAQHLRVAVHHRRRIPAVMRDALYHYSRCIVYPSIHREPFGMVAAEAMSRGTPVLVPDLGGITEAIAADGVAGGLTFRAWDSADLARQLERLLTDDALHAELAGKARGIAARFSVGAMTDAVLAHLGLESMPGRG